jgi:Tfp pilus assembly protein FimV
VTTPKAPAVDTSPVAAGFRYQVQAGDSLSQIVSRVEHRAIALWPAVDAVFAANPHAFLNNDRDLLRAGAWLVIPDMTGASAATPVEASAPLDAAAPVVNAMPAAPAELPLELTVEPAEDFVSPTGDADVAIDTPDIVAIDTPDIVVVDTPETMVVDIPDTVVEITPVAPLTADIKSTDTGATESWSRWLGGAGLTILFAALIFGRQIRDRFGSSAIGKSAVRPTRRKQAVAPRPLLAAASDEAYNVSVTAENFRPVAEDYDATVKDLQSLQVEEVGNSRFSFVSDFERKVFEQNFNKAIVAAGYAFKGIPEIAQDADASGDDFADRKARAS